MKQINLHEPGPGAQPGLAPKPYCVIGSGSWTCHEHPLCFSLLIPTEITASLLPPAIGKTVKFAHTKCLQQRLALCCHFSWDSDTSLMFNLVFFFLFNECFPRHIFLSVPGRQTCKVVISYRMPNHTPLHPSTFSHFPCRTVIWDRAERPRSLHFCCLWKQHGGSPMLCAEQFNREI